MHHIMQDVSLHRVYLHILIYINQSLVSECVSLWRCKIILFLSLNGTGCTSSCPAPSKARCSSCPSRAREWPCSAWVSTEWHMQNINFARSGRFDRFKLYMYWMNNMFYLISSENHILTYTQIRCREINFWYKLNKSVVEYRTEYW